MDLNPDGVNPESMTSSWLRFKSKLTKFRSPIALQSRPFSCWGSFTHTQRLRLSISHHHLSIPLCISIKALRNWCTEPSGFKRRWLYLGGKPQRGKACHYSECSFPSFSFLQLSKPSTFLPYLHNIYVIYSICFLLLSSSFSLHLFKKTKNYSTKWKTSICCHKWKLTIRMSTKLLNASYQLSISCWKPCLLTLL